MRKIFMVVFMAGVVAVASLQGGPPLGTAAAPDLSKASLAKIHPSLQSASGPVDVIIRLDDPPLAVAVGPNAKRDGFKLTPAAQKSYVATLMQKQSPVLASVVGSGGTPLAQLTKGINAVAASVNATSLPGIARLPNVTSIRPVRNYELDLSETVPYIGATAVQNLGVNGAGIRVAVLDSGIDYTHRNLGGPGTTAAYLAAYGAGPADPKNTTRDGLFPTAKVVNGYDFVGEVWPTGNLAPDPDPIDFEGHGTHVSDIIAGKSTDGAHVGVAPGASLYAVKVCSAVSTACSGVAILQGLDYALDPNGDNDLSDAVDVVNMSLGSPYGQVQDDSNYAVQVLSDFGIVMVISAGNNADLPYVVGSPSTAPGAISVAQTQVPSAKAFILTLTGPGVPGSPAYIRNTESVGWAPVNQSVQGPIVYVGRGCIGDPYLVPEASVAGKIALIDRGVCSISEKVDRAAKLGAVGVIVALNAPGDPVSFSYGGGTVFVPTVIITQADGFSIKADLLLGAVQGALSPQSFTPLVGSVVASSSRGPSYSNQDIKPDLGAPGASLSAQAGTGTGETVFGGTSGAAPMVAGAAALLLNGRPGMAPFEIKAMLMNTAETAIQNKPTTQPGVLAPITRIGGGEVRVDKALANYTLAYDKETRIPSLSFGYHAVPLPAKSSLADRTVEVRNLGNRGAVYFISSSFRYPDDQANGAVILYLSANSLYVPPRGKGTFHVYATVADPTKLRNWTLNGGTEGGNGEALRTFEYDGYITLTSSQEQIHLPWQILPHKAADGQSTYNSGTGILQIRNANGAVNGATEVFALTGTSGVDYPAPAPPGSNQAFVDLRSVGVRQAGANLQFAINTYGERSHPNYPAEFDVYIDTNGDLNPDYILYNSELNGFGTSGQSAVFVFNLAANTTAAYYYNDADLNSSTAIFTVPMSAVGVTPGAQFGFVVAAFDNYFTGSLTDIIWDQGGGEMLFTAAHPRWTISGASSLLVPMGGALNLSVVTDPLGAAQSPSQDGLLLLYRDAQPGRWAQEITLP